jgi:hypothetical protein
VAVFRLCETEAPDELVRVKPHGLPTARTVDAIVLPAERNRAVDGRHEAAIGDGEGTQVVVIHREDIEASSWTS